MPRARDGYTTEVRKKGREYGIVHFDLGVVIGAQLRVFYCSIAYRTSDIALRVHNDVTKKERQRQRVNAAVFLLPHIFGFSSHNR